MFRNRQKESKRREEAKAIRAEGLKFKVHCDGLQQSRARTGRVIVSNCSAKAFISSRTEYREVITFDGALIRERFSMGKPPLTCGGPIVSREQFSQIPLRYRCRHCHRVSLDSMEHERGQEYATAVEVMLFGIAQVWPVEMPHVPEVAA